MRLPACTIPGHRIIGAHVSVNAAGVDRFITVKDADGLTWTARPDSPTVFHYGRETRIDADRPDLMGEAARVLGLLWPDPAADMMALAEAVA
jgi:hypothetical protein